MYVSSISTEGMVSLPRLLEFPFYVVQQVRVVEGTVCFPGKNFLGLGWMAATRVLGFLCSCGDFFGAFCCISLCLLCWMLFEEAAILRCSSKWQKTIWSWELDPEIDCERFWEHFIFICSVSVFAEWTLTPKPTVLRLVRLCDFYFIFFTSSSNRKALLQPLKGPKVW